MVSLDNYSYYCYYGYCYGVTLSGGAIAGISVGAVLFIIIITLLIVSCVGVRYYYVKRKVRTYGVKNQDVVANETGNIVSCDSLQPQSTDFSYKQLDKQCAIKTTTSVATSESLPEFTLSEPTPPAYAPSDAPPATQDVVQ